MAEVLRRRRPSPGSPRAQHGHRDRRGSSTRAGFERTRDRASVDGEWLVRLHEGVYQLGVVSADAFADEMAALLAVRSAAAIARRSATSACSAAPVAAARPVEIVLPHEVDGEPGGHPRATGSRRSAASDVTVRHGLRVTTPARTLVDLAATTPPAELERLIEEVQVQRLASPAEILEAIRRGAGARASGSCRAVVDLLDEPLFTRSEAERRLKALLQLGRRSRCRGTNVKRAGWEVDAVWDRQRLVVEVDGYALPPHPREVRARPPQGRRSCSSRATACCASPGASSRASPTPSCAIIAAALAA